MATGTATTTLGPRDHGREMDFDEFGAAEWSGGFLYELARGIVVVTNVPRPEHGWIVRRIARAFDRFDLAHPGVISYLAGGGECRIRLPGMASDRHPDQALYLHRLPRGGDPWRRWVPAIVVEVVSRRGEHRDYVEKREEYLRFGVLEYWIFDPIRRVLVAHLREGDTWREQTCDDRATYRTELLPGLDVSVGEILGPPGAEIDEVEEGAEAGDDIPPAP